jgi:hypothetical protein
MLFLVLGYQVECNRRGLRFEILFEHLKRWKIVVIPPFFFGNDNLK